MHVILVVIYQAYVRYIRVDGPEYSNLNIFYKYFITEHVQLYSPFWLNIFFWMTVAFRQSYGFKS